ncbi:MAG: DUF4349 domain-containing protein [Gammaproteobacteria bacterium]|nr:DUF4349 domain-containing protein [Gammaproteobacteria bacterium]
MKTLPAKKSIFISIVVALVLALAWFVFTASQNFLSLNKSKTYLSAVQQDRVSYKLKLSSEFQALEDSAGLGKVLIKTGRLDISVKDTAKTYKAITAKIQESDGYISSFNSRNSDHIRLTIRVPVKNFHRLFEVMKEEADKNSSVRQSIDVQDATAKYTDIDSRIKSKKAIERRYLNILDKATKVTQVLQIEKELGSIRIEIERMEAKLKSLSNKSHFSTIVLEIQKIKEDELIKDPSMLSQIMSSLNTGWNQAILFMLFLMRNWFAVLLVLGVGFMIRKFYRNKPNNENS